MAVLTFSHQLCGTPTPSALLKNTTFCVVLNSSNRNSTTNHGPISLCLPCLEKWKIILSGSDIVVLVIKKNLLFKKEGTVWLYLHVFKRCPKYLLSKDGRMREPLFKGEFT